eukprot:XP_011663453.1 PREDICTED: flocculation protein FLO11 [Strongylocentrotus purpuratus]
MSTTSDGMHHGGQGVSGSSPDDQLDADIQRAMALSLETERMDELRRKRFGIPSLPTKTFSEKKPVAVTKSCSSAVPRGAKPASVQQSNLSTSTPKADDLFRGTSSGSSAAELDLMSFGFDHVMKNYSGPTAGNASTQPPGAGPLPSPGQSGMPLKSPHGFGMGQGLARSSQSMRQPKGGSMVQPSMETPSRNPFAPSFLPLNNQATALSRFHQTRTSFAASNSSADRFGQVLSVSHSQKQMSRSSPSSPETSHRKTSKSATTTPAEGNNANQETFSDLMSSLGVEIGGSKPAGNIQKDSSTTKSGDGGLSLINLAPTFEQITSTHKSTLASGISEQPPPLPPKARRSQQSHIGFHLEATSSSSSMRRIHSNPSFGTMETNTSISQSISSFGFASQASSQSMPQPGDRLPFAPPATTPSDSIDSNDLMFFRSSLADQADFFDFSYFDPLQPQAPEPTPEPTPGPTPGPVPSESQSQQTGTSAADAGSTESTSEDPQVRPRKAKQSESGQRPTSIEVEESEQAGKRPRSLYGAKGAAVEVAEPEPWIPKSAVSTASAKKSKPDKVFFGDGLFDLASQRDEEGETFAQTVSRSV